MIFDIVAALAIWFVGIPVALFVLWFLFVLIVSALNDR